jgi:peptide/nickel transport system permease protein
LASSALLLALAVALPLGIVAALRPGKAVDNVATLLTQCCIAIPEYWFAPVCILVFALYLGWLPSAGWRDASTMIMPTLVLALRPLAYFTRVTRASMVDVMQAPYITAARSKGLSLTSTVLRHGIRNGMLPVVTLFALWFAGTIGGSVAVEVIFAIPGMGRTIFEAVMSKDLPVLQGAFVLIVTLSVLASTAADFIYVWLNPVVRIVDGGK